MFWKKIRTNRLMTRKNPLRDVFSSVMLELQCNYEAWPPQRGVITLKRSLSHDSDVVFVKRSLLSPNLICTRTNFTLLKAQWLLGTITTVDGETCDVGVSALTTQPVRAFADANFVKRMFNHGVCFVLYA